MAAKKVDRCHPLLAIQERLRAEQRASLPVGVGMGAALGVILSFLGEGRAAAGPKARSGCICGPGSHGQQHATARWPKARDYDSTSDSMSQSVSLKPIS